MPNFTSCNPHIWIFWISYITVSVSQVCEQSRTSNLSLADGSLIIVVSMIYLKCTRSERKVLWNNLCMISSSLSVPWILGGNFHVISNAMEKAGGNSFYMDALADFNTFQQQLGLVYEPWACFGLAFGRITAVTSFTSCL